ncbi:hypothetical protein [Chamaesiphon sp. VAR_69_metabat_338]|uniref:hypothetical protein n=1 Tax=Chamaesiphon sp. VAR_69_metabat_338 TaxID=2964704 RepID=UPI00286E11DC|nr:hypothetical protein [Chamaesiphon sp. VAR_69_metabat_338]
MKNQEKMAMTARTYITISSLVVVVLWIVIGASQNASTRGLTGDFLGGVASPFIGLVSAILVYLSFQQQIRANKIQIEALKQESKRNNIRSTLNILKSEISDLILENPGDERKTYHGMQAFEKFVELLDRSSSEAISQGERYALATPALCAYANNENVADTIYSVLFIMQKEIAGMGGLTEELLKEFVDEFHIFYTLRLAKGLNSIESVSGNLTIDNIKESKRELVVMFQSYGYNI